MNIDWNEVWKERWEWTRENSPHKDLIAFWDSYAPRYYERIKKNKEERERLIKWIVDTFELTEESTVLEIGPGPGTYTIPFAKFVKKVTVVEPSRGMSEVLKKHAKEESVDNIKILHRRWEEVSMNDVESYDLVFASYSLGVPDLREAIEKMNALAKKGVCIITSAGSPGWAKVYEKLYPLVYGREYKASLGHIVLYNLLYQMGIYANVKIRKKKVIVEYDSIDEAVNDWAQRLRTEKFEAVKKGLLELLEISDKVRLSYDHYNAIIWWEKC
ncbi:class I SAM-dependent methyltransferase [Thermococcus sp. MV5]|uniref:class I SAM-dependent methyltransferase n=1 Tax=Thermococcus sp. MV5 TaxID=1638272 RepID=UPI00143A1048|nr:class I SAM-dependent methyltransferase [Thermococcus sp. MV5]NJE25554.1 class I SAM-dependent methyltransferase [Thermococcus sp. MV5]